MIYTVFPNDNKCRYTQLPQDCETYEEAKEYGEENFSECGYHIEETGGDVE